MNTNKQFLHHNINSMIT